MNVLRGRLLFAGLVLAVSATEAPAQVANFDDRPTGFLTTRIGGMPADASNGTPLATARRLVSAVPAAPGSRALRDRQFKVLASGLAPPPAETPLAELNRRAVGATKRALRQAGEDHAAQLFGIETAMAFGL